MPFGRSCTLEIAILLAVTLGVDGDCILLLSGMELLGRICPQKNL